MVLFPVQLQNIPAGVMVFFRSYFVSEIISLLPMITNLLVSNHNRIQMEKKMAQMEAKEEAIFHSSKLISLGQLAAEMVHEINRPLTTLLGYSQLLLEDDLSEQVHGSIRKIKMDALRAKGIIQDLSFITKGHNDHQTNFNINDMIHVAAKLMKNPLALANITLDEQFDQTLPTMSGEPGKILQVVLNILQNAADAISETKNGGTIGIATSFSSDSRYVMVRITDNGPGIPEKILKRIGEPFITTKGEKGTGLGLALSMKIMEKMRGRLDISTREKHGTHVCIIVPFYPQVEMSSQNAKPYPGQSHQIRPERSVSSRRAQEQRIFVIDDEPTIIDLITKVFERIGYKVESSSCARDALENLKENDYDVITLDVKMPDMTGTELYTELAKIKPELRSRVLFLTGDIASSELEDFLNETGCAYLMKPFDIDDLNREVSDILKKNT
jgi:signal transduction histidine kinase/CheY-like chemotaxis protein